MNNLNCKVRKVIISDIKQGTIFSKIILSNYQNNELTIDCRPSDAIALALRENCSIFISDKIINKMGISMQ